MATPPANPFSAPDYPGDAPVVLILVEGSGNMLICWNDIRSYILPFLLDALCAGHPESPVSFFSISVLFFVLIAQNV